jgi:hypothetical protein
MTQSTGTGQASAPFASGWWGTDLGKYRACDGTYCFFASESLPPLPALDGSLDWLGPLPEHLDHEMEIHRSYAPEKRGRIDTIAAQAEQLGLTLPLAFLRVMGTNELQERFPSCTACFFTLSERIVPCPAAERGYILRFLNDQQDVLLWYLHLTPGGGHCVVVSPYELDTPEDAEELTDQGRQNILANTWVCAPTFEAFLYRYWLENTIWFHLNESGNAPLTPEEQRYIAHYAAAQADG